VTGAVSNSASSRITKNGRKYTAFGLAIISDRNLQAFSYIVVAAIASVSGMMVSR
jgi:hypothetical protein